MNRPLVCLAIVAFSVFASGAALGSTTPHQAIAPLTQSSVSRDFVPQSEDAVAYQITPTHSGTIDGPTLKLPLSISWTASIGQFSTYPTIANGRVFVGGNNLVALNASTGARIWTKPSSSLGTAYDHGRLFTLSNGGQMSALTPASGRQLWFAVLPGQYSFSSPPTAGNGMVYTGGAGSGGTVYAVNETSGALTWTAGVENGDDSSPVVTSTGVYVSYACPQTYDFAPLTGALIWHYSGACEGGGGATAALYRNLLYVEDTIFGPPGLILQATDGTPVGTFNSSITPAFAKGIGYFVNGQTLTAVSTRTGNEKWVQTLNNGDGFFLPPIVITNTLSGDLVLCATESSAINVYDAQSGQLLQSLSLGATAEGGLAFSEGLLVVPAGNNVIGII